MNGKLQSIPSLFSQIFLISAVIFTFNLFLIAQNQTNSEKDKLLPPSEEKFEEATDLVVPWRESGCQKSAYEFNEPGCEVIKGYMNANILTIYNSDGSLWYRFNLNFDTPDYFYKNMKTGFIPFSIPNKKYDSPNSLILRMVEESKHWYKVEINEETPTTKFVLKSDSMWGTTKWSYWIYKSGNLFINSENTKFYDKPNGKIIEETAEIDFQRVAVTKVEGDWVLVADYISNGKYQGWIRWRKGRDILVGCIFNEFKVPEVKTVK